MTTRRQIFSSDSFVVDHPITFPTTGSVTSLVGATTTATMTRERDGLKVTGTTAIAGNTVTTTFAPGTIAAGDWTLQVKVTKAGQSQVVVSVPIRVLTAN